MRISVVVATWNGAAFVEQQLASILGQDRRPDEVIVCDDGSTDRTLAIVSGLRAETAVPLTVIEQPRRLGVAGNVESGVRRATGDVIALADQDDVWRADKLARVEAALGDGPRLMFSDGRILGSTGTLWDSMGLSQRDRRRLTGGRVLEQVLRWNPVTGATVAFTADLREVLVPFSAAGFHDAWMALISAAVATVTAVPDQLIDYRLHGSNLAGVPPTGHAARLQQRRAQEDLRGRESQFFEDAVDRLTAAGAPADALAQVHRKLAFVRSRATLPPSLPRRAATVARHLVTGRYRRYSKRVAASAVYDVVYGG